MISAKGTMITITRRGANIVVIILVPRTCEVTTMLEIGNSMKLIAPTSVNKRLQTSIFSRFLCTII